MKNIHGLTLLVAGICGFSPSFAADQPAPAAAPLAPVSSADPTVESTTSKPTAVATDSLSATPPANAADADAAAKAAAAAKEEKKYRSQGYRPHVKNGETYWCKSDLPIGSRLPTTTCSTVAQMQEQERQAQDTVKEIQMHNQSQPAGH